MQHLRVYIRLGATVQLAGSNASANGSTQPAPWLSPADCDHYCRPVAEQELCHRMAMLAAVESSACAEQQQQQQQQQQHWWQLPTVLTPATMRQHVHVFRNTLDGLQLKCGRVTAAQEQLLDSAAQAAGGRLTSQHKSACMATPQVRCNVCYRQDTCLRNTIFVCSCPRYVSARNASSLCASPSSSSGSWRRRRRLSMLIARSWARSSTFCRHVSASR